MMLIERIVVDITKDVIPLVDPVKVICGMAQRVGGVYPEYKNVCNSMFLKTMENYMKEVDSRLFPTFNKSVRNMFPSENYKYVTPEEDEILSKTAINITYIRQYLCSNIGVHVAQFFNDGRIAFMYEQLKIYGPEKIVKMYGNGNAVDWKL